MRRRISNLVALSLVALMPSACGYFEDWGDSEEPSTTASDTTTPDATVSHISDGHRASHHSHPSHHSQYGGSEHSHGRRH